MIHACVSYDTCMRANIFSDKKTKNSALELAINWNACSLIILKTSNLIYPQENGWFTSGKFAPTLCIVETDKKLSEEGLLINSNN